MVAQNERKATERATAEDTGVATGTLPRPVLDVSLHPINAIKPYERNPRAVPERAVEAVADSIRSFGFRVPLVCDEQMELICGHTRLLAARKLGLTEVPVHIARGLSPEQVRAFRIADNRTSQLTNWNDHLLAEELRLLSNVDFDLSLLAFDDDELLRLIALEEPTIPLGDPDEVPEPPDDPVSKPGDVWVLGRHRLMCGDAGNAAHVDTLLAGAKVHLIHTDPPYNVKVEPRSNNAIAAGNSSFTNQPKKRRHHQALDLARHPEKNKPTSKKMRAKDRPLINDFVSDEEFTKLLNAWFGQIARVLEPGRAFYIWGGYGNLGNYPPALAANGLYFSQGIVWNKQHPVLTRKDFMGAYEICFYGWREGAGHKYYGPNNATDLWHVKKVNQRHMTHLTEKPVELAALAMQYSSREGENVLDLFSGSGSTLIAAETTGRRCFALELDPAYTDQGVLRWEQVTGKKAERIAAE